MGIGDDIAPRPKVKAEKPKVEETKKPELEPGEVEVGVNVAKKTDKENKDLYSDFLADWGDDDHHHHLHEHQNDQIDEEDSKQSVKKEKKSSGSLVKWIVLFFVILIAIIVWQNYSKIAEIFNFSKESETSEDEGVSYYDNSSTDYTAPSETEPATTDNQVANSNSTTPSIDKSSIAIQVLNGNGVSGTAATVKSLLVADGFTVSSTTNARKFTYPTSIVYYKTGKEAEAKLVNESLSGYVTELINEDSVMGVYDVVIVIGAT